MFTCCTRAITLIVLIVVSLNVHAAPPLFKRRVWPEKPHWAGFEIDDPKFLTGPNDKKSFSTKLSGITLGTEIPNSGLHSDSMWTVKGKYIDSHGKEHDGSGLIVKVLNKADNGAYGEVKTLNIVGDLVASGKLSVDKKLLGIISKSSPVIVMSMKPGEALNRIDAFQRGDEKVKEKLTKEALALMCEEVATVAHTKGILHNDNNMGNILVTLSADKTTVISIKLVDWGAPRTYTASVTKEEALEWCKGAWPVEQWKKAWKIRVL